MTYQHIRSRAVRELLPQSGLGGIFDVVSAIVGVAATAVAPHYTTVSGVCKPTDSPTLELFKELQRQINRVAKVKGFAAIGVDGDIGGGTVAAMQAVQKAAKADLQAGKLANTYAATALALVQSSTCSGIAAGATGTAADVKTYADQLGVTTSVASPAPAQPPAVYNPITGVAAPQGMAASAVDAFKRMSTGAQAATLGALGVAGYLVLVPPKGKKKRK